ncbi:MAG: TIGR02281 family clan AA aspartic protease [Gammaproteobacteria bacterium]|nr:TIGR02281 family clan AA aspartic protease [Gammaproteobacteria bacterium]
MTKQGDTKRLGAGMIVTAWIVIFVLFVWYFSRELDKQHNPNQNIQKEGAVTEVVLQRNHFGHYVASGEINGHEVEFMLDTGASDVAIGVLLAQELGLKKGRSRMYQTANGKVEGYRTLLDTVRIGSILVNEVRGSIIPGLEGRQVLLGMSFLKHLEFTQRGETLILRP